MMTRKRVPPDGGWGWLIIVGASLINFSTRSLEPSFGLLFGRLFKELGIETTGASLVISTLSSMINFTGLAVGPLLKRFTVRKVAIAGGLITTSAYWLTAPAKNIIHILITFGVLGGIGFGISSACTFVAINEYFSKRKGQAFGLAFAGTAVGFMFLPQVVRYLLDEYDFRSACIIVGALSLHGVVGACLFQPVSWHKKTEMLEEDPRTLLLLDKIEKIDSPASSRNSNERKRKVNSVNLDGGKILLNNASKGILSKDSLTSTVSLLDGSENTIQIQRMKKDESETEIAKLTVNLCKEETHIKITPKQKPKQEIKEFVKNPFSKISDLLDLDLLTDGIFLNIICGISMLDVVEMNFRLILPFYLSDLGFTYSEVATALSLMSTFDTCARLMVHPIIDRTSLTRRFTFEMGLFFVALGRSFLTLQKTYVQIITTLMVIGFLRGITVPSYPLVLAEYSAGKKFPSILGLCMVSKGIFIAVLGPLSGYIRDTTDSYHLFIHFQTLLISLVFIAWIVEIIILKSKNKKRARKDALQKESED